MTTPMTRDCSMKIYFDFGCNQRLTIHSRLRREIGNREKSSSAQIAHTLLSSHALLFPVCVCVRERSPQNCPFLLPVLNSPAAPPLHPPPSPRRWITIIPYYIRPPPLHGGCNTASAIPPAPAHSTGNVRRGGGGWEERGSIAQWEKLTRDGASKATVLTLVLLNMIASYLEVNLQ